MGRGNWICEGEGGGRLGSRWGLLADLGRGQGWWSSPNLGSRVRRWSTKTEVGKESKKNRGGGLAMCRFWVGLGAGRGGRHWLSSVDGGGSWDGSVGGGGG